MPNYTLTLKVNRNSIGYTDTGDCYLIINDKYNNDIIEIFLCLEFFQTENINNLMDDLDGASPDEQLEFELTHNDNGDPRYIHLSGKYFQVESIISSKIKLSEEEYKQFKEELYKFVDEYFYYQNNVEVAEL